MAEYIVYIQPPEGQGVVEFCPNGSSCNTSPGVYTLPESTCFTIRATPASGWVFSHWQFMDQQITSPEIKNICYREYGYTIKAYFNPGNGNGGTLPVFVLIGIGLVAAVIIGHLITSRKE